MNIQILIDNLNSWIIPHAKNLLEKIQSRGHHVSIVHEHSAVTKGDVLILLSCEKRFLGLSLNKHNLVVHESALPQGKGWSPLTWQVLEGKTRIPITLFEASEEIDAGAIYCVDEFTVEKTDLVEDLRAKQAAATNSLILNFLDNYPLAPVTQSGAESFYRKRAPKDSELTPEKSILEQWPAFQVADNLRYPAFIVIDGQKFFIRISKE